MQREPKFSKVLARRTFRALKIEEKMRTLPSLELRESNKTRLIAVSSPHVSKKQRKGVRIVGGVR